MSSTLIENPLLHIQTDIVAYQIAFGYFFIGVRQYHRREIGINRRTMAKRLGMLGSRSAGSRLLQVVLLLCLVVLTADAQSRIESQVRIARLKYSGGGDWYNDPSAEVNLLKFIKENTTIDTDPRYEFVDLASEKLFSYPILFMTGHGNVVFSDYEVQRLRSYLTNGGFLYVDDDYGLDKAFRRELKKVFPDQNLVELPFNYGLYNCHFSFPNGVPKTHEHDTKPPQGFGLFYKERLIVYYTFESNPSDGWADPEVHGDPEPVRQQALRFGTNIVVWALSH